ncbi:MAG: hypothetical protein NTZ35_01415 [Ignavibacteriales bacterium]|nr:hypothetical protein [Ignavibacteriales bacterium]
MSKLNQIQNRLKELDGAAFQKLADAYLRRKGYERINPMGSVVGADRVRQGTPDTFIPLANGKYVFAEHTVQKDRLLEKLESDLDKCFNESKTGVPVGKIEEIVFCYASELTLPEVESLGKACRGEGVNLSLFGVGPMSFDLYQKYPGLAKDFLGIEIDTGQIVTQEEFVTWYNANLLAAPIDTTFHFRDAELGESVKYLEESDLLIVSGKAGVGKSRIALECCTQFMNSHPNYKVACISNRGPDLFEDLRVHFAEPGDYLIFVDDANRVNRFEYILQLLQDHQPDRRIKVVATVRDYALPKVKEASAAFGISKEIVLHDWKDEEIVGLVRDVFGIDNYLFLERIARISKGNPRLAMMAATLAKQSGTFESISDVSSLYDAYYNSLRTDMVDLLKPALLKTAGIIAFFRVIDLSDKNKLQDIEQAFGMGELTIRDAVVRLHELEIFDLYENEVVRVSDQILSTYLFYRAFFKEKVIDFAALLEFFFPQLRERLIESLNPVVDAFYGDALVEAMRPPVDKAWQRAIQQDDFQKLLHLMNMFFFLKETDTLLFMRDKIQNLEVENAAVSLDVDELVSAPAEVPSILSILGLFNQMSIRSFEIALGLLLDYLVKRPGDSMKVAYVLIDRFGFTHRSYAEGFVYQQKVIDKVLERCKGENSNLPIRMFLLVAKHFLRTRFHRTEFKGGQEFNMINFELPPMPSLFEVRRSILRGLILLFDMGDYKESVLKVIHTYGTAGYHVSSSEIIKSDSEILIPFVKERFDRNDLNQSLIAGEYFDCLARAGVVVDEGLKRAFKSDVLQVADFMMADIVDERYRDMSYDQYMSKRKAEIHEHLKDKNKKGLCEFIDECRVALSVLRNEHKRWQFREGLAIAMIAIAEHHGDLFSAVVHHYLMYDDEILLEPWPIIKGLIDVQGVPATFEFIDSRSFRSKRRWMFMFFSLLEQDQIDHKYASILLECYRESDQSDLPHHLDFLLRYETIRTGLVLQVVEIVLEKAVGKPEFARSLSMLFNPYTEVCKSLRSFFTQHLTLLKKLYYAVLNADEHADYNRAILAMILGVDRGFMIEYIDWMYARKHWLSMYDDMHDYSFLWMKVDYKDLMTSIIEHVQRKVGDSGYFGSSYLECFFATKEATKEAVEIRARQDEVILELIEKRAIESKLMEFLFWLLTSFEPDRRRKYLEEFLKRNKNIEDFKKIPIEPTSWSASGSWVPVIQSRIDYLETLLPLLNVVELLEHKVLVEQQIDYLRKRKESEKKSDFMGD